jgi:hypothetical protein
MIKSNTVISEYEEQIRKKMRTFFVCSKAKRDPGYVYEESYSIKLIKADNKDDFLILISQYTNIDNYFLIEYVEYTVSIKGRKVFFYRGTLIRDDSFIIF